MDAFDNVVYDGFLLIILETALFCFLVITFLSCMKVLLTEPSTGEPKKRADIKFALVIAAVLMLLIGFVSVVVGLAITVNKIHPSQEEGNWVIAVQLTCFACQVFIADAILLLRCFSIYNRDWRVVALPCLLWVGTTVSSLLLIVCQGTTQFKACRPNPFVEMLSFSLAMNIMTTSLMIHRIWKIQNEMRARFHLAPSSAVQSSVDSVTRFKKALLESGLVYTVCVAILFGVYFSKTEVSFKFTMFLYPLIVQIVGICFNAIIINVSRGTAIQPPPAVMMIDNFTSTAHRVQSPLIRLQLHTVTEVVRDPPENHDESKVEGRKVSISVDPVGVVEMRPEPEWIRMRDIEKDISEESV